MKSQGYLGAAIATSVGNFLRMLWVIFKRLGVEEVAVEGWELSLWMGPVFLHQKSADDPPKKSETVECEYFCVFGYAKFLLQMFADVLWVSDDL